MQRKFLLYQSLQSPTVPFTNFIGEPRTPSPVPTHYLLKPVLIHSRSAQMDLWIFQIRRLNIQPSALHRYNSARFFALGTGFGVEHRICVAWSARECPA
ncbi:hypothetical protein AVEN_102002-1 [Araneus ventricosus]|uniref:Uncharacterized protein n=1 Tax=Araneus ventricosus TaxID=182803 RepID=A0A4Y2I8Q8_ARAVE|nr:hypothetical protein AVEN_102002-1 [Araneus ventricosus]